MPRNFIDTFAGSTLAGLIFTAVWWGVANAPLALLFAAATIIAAALAVLALAAIAACIVGNRGKFRN